MRISDWSSDVCSSDLHPHSAATRLARSGTGWRVTTARGSVTADTVLLACGGDRKSDVEGKSVSVRVDLGGRRIIKTKKTVNQYVWDQYRSVSGQQEQSK